MDSLGFNVSIQKIPKEIINGSRKPTKREFLKIIMSVYDPPGLIAPFTLKSRILMQEIWQNGVGWDVAISDDEHAAWMARIEAYREIEACRVPRYVAPKNEPYSSVQFHAICDTSAKAYAAAIYIRCSSRNRPTHPSQHERFLESFLKGQKSF